MGFTLNAETLDGGEQVISITLHTGRLGPIDPASLTDRHLQRARQGHQPDPVVARRPIFSEYDLDRAVTAARLDRRGNIVLDLAYGEGQARRRHPRLHREQGPQRPARPRLHDHAERPDRLRTAARSRSRGFVQGGLSNPEVDAFSYHVSALGHEVPAVLAGRSRSAGRGRHPLIVWLHGGGEGASLPDDYYDNETTLRANRGALGFATAEAQRIFAGAYVVAPQSTSYWIEDGPRFAPLIREIIGDLVRRTPSTASGSTSSAAATAAT